MNTPYPKPRMPYNNNTKLSSNSLFAKKKKSAYADPHFLLYHCALTGKPHFRV